MARKSLPERTAAFIESMECLPVSEVPEGPEWTYELKLDGYRLEVVQTQKETTLYSRRRNILNRKFPYIAAALKGLPNGTVIDGELVALGSDGRPDFNLAYPRGCRAVRLFRMDKRGSSAAHQVCSHAR